MKLIIDIDEKLVCEGFERIFTEEERDILIRAIGHGTPYEERPHGEWVMNKISPRGRNYTCTNCQKVSRSKSEFCQKCGADMRVKDEYGRVQVNATPSRYVAKDELGGRE